MIASEDSPSMKTPNELSPPKLMLKMDVAWDGTDNFFDAINIDKILRYAVEATYKWLFTAETAPARVKSITLMIAHNPLLDSTMEHVESGIENDEAYIAFLGDYYETFQDKYGAEMAKETITAFIIQEATGILLKSRYNDESYPCHFQRGFADYVKLKEGFLPPYEVEEITENVWYDYCETMPYFLDWIETQYGEGTVHRLIETLQAPYDENVFEKVTGTPISSLWQTYCDSVGKEHREEEEWNTSLLELWPIPKLKFSIEGDLEEGDDIFFDSTVKPIDALAEALLATFNHLYTPQTIPENLKQISLVLKSGVEKPCDMVVSNSHANIIFSLETIKSSKPLAVDDLVIMLIICVYACYRACSSRHNYSSRSSEKWLEGIDGFVILKEDLFYTYSDETEWNEFWDHSTANILLWIEDTAGEGTVKRFYQLMMEDKYDPMWFVELTGKPLDQLLSEYKTVFPEAHVPKELLCSCCQELSENLNNDVVVAQEVTH